MRGFNQQIFKRGAEVLIWGLGAALFSLHFGAPHAWASEDARVLPAGRSRLSLIYAQSAGVSDEFDDQGKASSITAPYNLELSSQTLAAAVPQINQLVQSLDTLYSNFHFNPNQTNNGSYGVTQNPNDESLGQALKAGFLNVSGSGTETQSMVAYQYGVTDHLSIGIMVPIVHYDVTISHSITGQNTAQDIYNALASQDPTAQQTSTVLDPLRSALSQLGGLNDSTLQSFLSSRGYDPVLPEFTQTGLGDTVLGARYLYFDRQALGGHWLSSFQGGITAPTGALKDPAQVASQDLGQGVWQLAVADLVNYSPTRVFMFSGGIHLTQPLPGGRVMRVRSDPGDMIPDAADQQQVSMHLGATGSLTVGAKATITDFLSLDSGYSWSWKGPDTYTGSRNIDYSYLSMDTFEYLETLNFSVSLSSVDRFLAHKALLPGDLSLGVVIPTEGKNLPIAPYGVAQVAMYF